MTAGTSIAVAESLTGGMVASLLVNQPGISAVFRGGIVAYHREVKERLLKVPRDTIDTYGVVSAEVAVAMARGAAAACESDIAVATTGVAGPGPEDSVAPGTVWIGREDGRAWLFRLAGDRAAVRAGAARIALEILTEQLSQASQLERMLGEP